MKQQRVFRVLFAFLLGFILAGCAVAQSAPDYSDPALWLALPSYTSMETDIFYLYPTSCSGAESDGYTLCVIDDPCMRQGAQVLLERQILVFESIGDVYAPYYSQVAGPADSLPQEERRRLVSGTPKEDVFAAFDYYMKNYNLGRRFILVGASQGAEILLLLLSEYMRENPLLYGQMDAACLTDCTPPEEFLRTNPHLRLARASDGEGFVISYAGNVSSVPER